MATKKKATKRAKRSKKPTNVKDLPATGASAVKGGASLNFGKVTFKYC